jgi:hypothetical protein
MQPQKSDESGGQSNQDQIVFRIITQLDMLTQTRIAPRQYDKATPIITFRNQEVARYNVLIDVIQNDMIFLLKAIKG